MTKIAFKGQPVNTYNTLPQVGTKAPDFSLTGAELEELSLTKDFAGKKKLLYFVPSIDTKVCAESTRQLSELAKEKPNGVFFIISADLPFAQKHFCIQESIANLILLSSFRSPEFGKNYGVLIQDGPVQGLLARAILVLDENNSVLFSHILPEISDHPDFSHPFHLL